MKQLPLITLFFSLFFAGFGVAADLEITYGDDKEIGSGAAKLTHTYSAGGLDKVGLFVGQPNELDRCDRVLVRFSLLELLKMDKKIKKAELILTAEYLYDLENKEGASEGRVIDVYKLNEAIEALGAEALTTVAVGLMGSIAVEPKMQRLGNKINPPRMILNITDKLADLISSGETSIIFRLQDRESEETGNSLRKAKGVSISKVSLYAPKIKIAFE